MTRILASGGLDGPPNTLRAFTACLDAGLDGFSLDVRLSRDAELVVIRDATVDGTSDGRGAVDELTLAELQRLDVGRDGCAERIPTLHEVLDLVEGADALVTVEVHEAPRHGPGVSPTAVAAAELLRSRELGDRVVLSSYRHDSLAALKLADPTLRIGARHVAQLADAGGYLREVGADVSMPVSLAVTPGTLAEARAGGVQVHAWTVSAPGWPVSESAQIDALLDLEVDAVITGDPRRAIARREASA